MTNRLRSLLHVPIADVPIVDVLLFDGPDAVTARGDLARTVADALVIDISGGMPHADDSRGRAVADLVRTLVQNARARVFVRVSGVASGRLEADLALVLPSRPFGVMLADVAGPIDVEELGARLRVSEAELGRADGETRIIPVLGTPAGVLSLAGGAAWPLARIAAMAWEPPLAPEITPAGLPDFAFNGAARLARNLTALAAARAGVPAIDPLPETVQADDAFRHACLAARHEGIGGRMVRNAAQAVIADAAFARENGGQCSENETHVP